MILLDLGLILSAEIPSNCALCIVSAVEGRLLGLLFELHHLSFLLLLDFGFALV